LFLEKKMKENIESVISHCFLRNYVLAWAFTLLLCFPFSKKDFGLF